MVRIGLQLIALYMLATPTFAKIIKFAHSEEDMKKVVDSFMSKLLVNIEPITSNGKTYYKFNKRMHFPTDWPKVKTEKKCYNDKNVDLTQLDISQHPYIFRILNLVFTKDSQDNWFLYRDTLGNGTVLVPLTSKKNIKRIGFYENDYSKLRFITSSYQRTLPQALAIGRADFVIEKNSNGFLLTEYIASFSEFVVRNSPRSRSKRHSEQHYVTRCELQVNI